MKRGLLSFAGIAIVAAATGVWIGLPKGRALPDCPTTMFAQQARIFDVVTVCATHEVPDAALRHAANVVAEWLDNDSDGQLDEPALLPAMRQTRPYLIMTEHGSGLPMLLRLQAASPDRVGQDLFASETNPGNGMRDASQEEIHHLIYNSGWAPTFPDIFADREGSALYQQWQKAEAEGHYFYDDPTCTAACKVSEFIYSASAADLGSDADLATDELRLYSREELTAALPDLIAIMASDSYTYPRDHWPTGNYPHAANITYHP